MAIVSHILLVTVAIIAWRPALVLGHPAPSIPPECVDYMDPNGTTTLSPKPPRVFPFCVGKDPETNSWPAKIKNLGFDKIIEKINGQSIVSYDANVHFLYEDEAQLNQHRVYRLRHQFSKGEFVVMDNWLNQQFADFKKPIEGLYIQGIQGPLGLPFGEFVNLKHTYDQNEDYAKSNGFTRPSSGDLEKVSLVSCTFFSVAGPTIPNVFVWKGSATKARFNVTFRWEDPPCAEVAFFQFIVIVVFKWDSEYKAGLSPMIFPGKFMFDSVTGLAYPNYPDWIHEEVYTTRRKEDTDAFSTGPFMHVKLRRIISNLDYEYCVQHGYKLEKKGPKKGQCPPGPFICDSYYIGKYIGEHKTPSLSAAAKQNLWDEWYPIYTQYKPARPHCGVKLTTTTPGSTTPTTTSTTTTETTTTIGTTTSGSTTETTTTIGTTTSGSTTTVETTTVDINITTEEPTTTTTTTERPKTEVDNKTEELNIVIKKTERKKVISHGDLCCLVWFVILPLANYIARCFKDFPNWKGIGLGFWIVAHVVIHHAGVLFMWISFGLVVSNGVAFFGGASGAHYLFGFPCTLIQHYELFSGFIRDSKSVPMAQRQSIVHVVNGYISSVFSLFCAMYSHINPIRWYLIIAMFTLNGVFFILGTMVEYKVSQRLGMYPARKMFPVMERIVLEGGKKPVLLAAKIAIFVGYTIIISALFTLYVYYTNKTKT